MREAVLDAVVVLKWFRDDEPDAAVAQALLTEFGTGQLSVRVPPTFFFEVLNIVGRSWRWATDEVAAVAERLDLMSFDVTWPQLLDVAEWVGRGLTAYDAAYVAIADAAGVPLVTVDEEILSAAPGVARRLGDGW